MNRKFIAGACAAMLVLSACGGGNGADAVPGAPVARGTVLQARLVAQHSAAALNGVSAGAAAPAGEASCGVAVYHVDYTTIDPQGRPATASAGVMLPVGAAAPCSGPRPVLLYAHGTSTLKSYDTSQPDKTPEARLVETAFAAHGYVVIAPNYLGYDSSSLDYHPYLVAEAQAADMIDGLRAGLAQLATAGGAFSGGLFLSGYSQGGYVALATQRALKRDHAEEFPVTAAAPMSGPYDLAQFADDIGSPDSAVNVDATLLMPLLITGYQRSLGGLYDKPSDVYQAPFDRTSPGLFPSDKPLDQLVAERALPAGDPLFQKAFGDGGLLTDGFRQAFAGSALRTALAANTLLGWSPKAPLAVCGGANDPTVHFSNALALREDMATRSIAVTLWNLEDRSTLPAGAGGPNVYDNFQLAKLLSGAHTPARYHGELVPPFCMALVRGFFARLPSRTDARPGTAG